MFWEFSSLGNVLMAENLVYRFGNSLKTELIEDLLLSLFVVVGLFTFLFVSFLGI